MVGAAGAAAVGVGAVGAVAVEGEEPSSSSSPLQLLRPLACILPWQTFWLRPPSSPSDWLLALLFSWLAGAVGEVYLEGDSWATDRRLIRQS